MNPSGFSSSIVSRRAALKMAGCGFGYLALAGLAAGRAQAANPLAPRLPHFAAKAKRVIFLFMQGGVSHVDSFDYKPILAEQDGKTLDFTDARLRANTGKGVSSQRVMKSPWDFSQYGQSGKWASTLFPEINQAMWMTCASSTRSIPKESPMGPQRSSCTAARRRMRYALPMGAWVNYGLGSENENLPGFVTIGPFGRERWPAQLR